MLISKKVLSELVLKTVQTIDNWERAGHIKYYWVQKTPRIDVVEAFKYVYGDAWKYHLDQALYENIPQISKAKQEDV